MAIIEEFPPFKLCALCKEIFPSADDINVDDNIQSQIWTNDEGYSFTRTREEIERGAMESCEFCTDIVQDDGAYKQLSSPDRQNETTGKEDAYERSSNESDEGSEQESELVSGSEEAYEGPDYIAMFSGQRAGWFPPIDERLGLKIKFHSEYKHLAVYDSNDRLIGRTWCLYTTPGRFLLTNTLYLSSFSLFLQTTQRPSSFTLRQRWQISDLQRPSDL